VSSVLKLVVRSSVMLGETVQDPETVNGSFKIKIKIIQTRIIIKPGNQEAH